jgi:hypothetical protein
MYILLNAMQPVIEYLRSLCSMLLFPLIINMKANIRAKLFWLGHLLQQIHLAVSHHSIFQL